MLIGIDLGTTNSLVACFRNGRAELIPNRLGSVLTPSVVSVDPQGNLYIGEAARERALVHPLESAAVFKRSMGTDRDFVLGEFHFRAEELSSLILKSLKEDAEAHLGEEITDAIIYEMHIREMTIDSTSGVKDEWKGEIEVVDASFEFVEFEHYVLSARDLTDKIGIRCGGEQLFKPCERLMAKHKLNKAERAESDGNRTDTADGYNYSLILLEFSDISGKHSMYAEDVASKVRQNALCFLQETPPRRVSSPRRPARPQAEWTTLFPW